MRPGFADLIYVWRYCYPELQLKRANESDKSALKIKRRQLNQKSKPYPGVLFWFVFYFLSIEKGLVGCVCFFSLLIHFLN